MTQHTRATIERVIPDRLGLSTVCGCSRTYLPVVNVLVIEHDPRCTERYAAHGYTVVADAHRDAPPVDDTLEDDAGDHAQSFALDAPLTGILTDAGRALAAKGAAADSAVDALFGSLDELPPPRQPDDPTAPVMADRPRGHADRLADAVARLNDAILDASLDGLHVECAYTQTDLITGQVTLIDVVRVSRAVASHGALAGGALARHRER